MNLTLEGGAKMDPKNPEEEEEGGLSLEPKSSEVNDDDEEDEPLFFLPSILSPFSAKPTNLCLYYTYCLYIYNTYILETCMNL